MFSACKRCWCHIGIALRNFKRRTLKLASVRRDIPRHDCGLELASGLTSSWVNTPVGIVAGAASRGEVAHIGVTSGHVSPHLVAGDGRQARRRVVPVTGTPMGFIIPQLGWGVTQLSEHQRGFENYPRCRGICCGPNGKPLLVLRQPVQDFNTFRVWVSIVDGGSVGCSLPT